MFLKTELTREYAGVNQSDHLGLVKEGIMVSSLDRLSSENVQ